MPSIDRANRTTRDRRHRQRRRRQHQHQRPHSDDDDDDVDAAPAPPPNPSHLSSAPRPLSAPPAALSLCAPSRETPNATRKWFAGAAAAAAGGYDDLATRVAPVAGLDPIAFSFLFPNRRNLRWEETGETQTRAGERRASVELGPQKDRAFGEWAGERLVSSQRAFCGSNVVVGMVGKVTQRDCYPTRVCVFR